MRYTLLALLLATPAFANGTDEAQDATPNIYGEPQAQSEGVPRECDVCTARHKSLQRLQQQRLSLPDEKADPDNDG
ncbi:MAG: hypothetical protein RIA08_15240 [Roseovarius sp.]|uniref:hypothetical protein n=1 Tax=Roseovarius sp. TaxID=1486281 RepID=UPI0032ED1921